MAGNFVQFFVRYKVVLTLAVLAILSVLMWYLILTMIINCVLQILAWVAQIIELAQLS